MGRSCDVMGWMGWMDIYERERRGSGSVLMLRT